MDELSDTDSSSDVMHDYVVLETDVFNYDDPLALSPQLQAVIVDDVSRLRALLQGGKSVNINDNHGNTPLHVAILKEKRNIFDYLLTVEDIRLDAENFEGRNPLIMACEVRDPQYALELLKNKVEVDVACNFQKTPLHKAVSRQNYTVVEALICSGAKVNCQDWNGNTPLHIACRVEPDNSDLIHFLLWNEADVTIVNDNGYIPFDSVILDRPAEVQQTLYDHTFDETGGSVSLTTLTLAMIAKSPYFYKLVEKNVTYTDVELGFLRRNMYKIPTSSFRIFMNRNESLVWALFSDCTPFETFPTSDVQSGLELLSVLCESKRFRRVLFKDRVCLKYVHPDIFTEEDATQYTLFLLSYGYQMQMAEFYDIFLYYGYCELFSILLHIDIPNMKSPYRQCRIRPKVILPTLIKDYSTPLSVLKYFERTHYYDRGFSQLMALFRYPPLVEHAKMRQKQFERDEEDTDVISTVPSLIELARNAARPYLVQRYQIRRPVQFFTLLRVLPIPPIIRDILSYKRTIYS